MTFEARAECECEGRLRTWTSPSRAGRGAGESSTSFLLTVKRSTLAAVVTAVSGVRGTGWSEDCDWNGHTDAHCGDWRTGEARLDITIG